MVGHLPSVLEAIVSISSPGQRKQTAVAEIIQMHTEYYYHILPIIRIKANKDLSLRMELKYKW